MRSLRRLSAPAWLAFVRVASRRGRVALVVVGIAASALMLTAVHAGVVIAKDASIADRVEALPPDVRAIRVSAFGATGQSDSYAALDRRARDELTPLLDREPIRTVLYKESTIGGAYLSIGAVDGLERWVRLTSGRLPGPCTPGRCEVVHVGGRGRIPNVPGLRLVKVGRGELTSTVLFGDAIAPTKNARYEQSLSEHYRRASRYHLPAPAPIVLAEGVQALSRSPVLQTYRTFGWVVPLDPERVHAWSVDALVRDIEAASSTLGTASASFQLRAPTEELDEAREATTIAGRRLLLLGGQASALLLAFAVLAATRLRRDVDAARQRLTWLGAPPWQIRVTLSFEAGLVAVVGAALGWGGGIAAAGLVARESGRPAGDVLVNSVLSAEGIALALVVGGLAVAAVVAALSVRPFQVGARSVSPLDVAALGAASVVAVALARGEADAGSLAAGRGTGVVLLLLPALIAFATAVLVARVLPPVLRALERATPTRAIALRLAAVALARNPGYAAVTAAFLVVSLGLAVFAESYRSTLVKGQRDQAAFAVPADFVLREDLSRLIPVRDAAAPSVLSRLRRDARVSEVTRLTGSLSGATDVSGIAVLGLDPPALRSVGGWRDDFSERPLAALASAVEPKRPVRLAGARLPTWADRLTLPAAARGRTLSVTASIQARDGSFVHVELGSPRDTARPLSASIPSEARGGDLVALRLDPPARLVERGGDAGGPAEAVLTLGSLRATEGRRARVVTDFRDWRGVDGARRTSGSPVRLRLTLTRATDTYFRPSQPTDDAPIAALVSRRLADVAGDDGLLPLEVAGERVEVRVAGVADRFPSARANTFSGDFAVLDRESLVTALNAARPGAGFTNEIWVDGREDEEARLAAILRRPPFDVLALESRRALAEELRREPISRTSLVMLAAAALVALLLALTGLVLGTVAELRDERGELFDLEAQGLGPAALRRQVRLRALVVVGFGLAGAALTGLLLSLLVVTFVRVTAAATRPEPPLLLAFSWPVVAAALACAVVLAGALVGAATWAAFRAPAAPRYGEVVA